VFQFLVIFISVQDIPYLDCFRLLVNGINNSVFTLVHSVALEFFILKILQLFEVLRGRISTQRENLDENLLEDFGIGPAEVLQLR